MLWSLYLERLQSFQDAQNTPDLSALKPEHNHTDRSMQQQEQLLLLLRPISPYDDLSPSL